MPSLSTTTIVPRTLSRSTPTCIRPSVLLRAPVLHRQLSSTSRPVVSTSVKRTNQSVRTFSMSAGNYNSDKVPTFGFAEKQPSEEEKQLVEDIVKLYQLKPSTAVYARYSPEATFHDPIGIANGLDSIKAQFNGLVKGFSKSDTVGLKYLDNPEVKPPSVQFSLSQNYTLSSMDKLVNSKITLHVDPATKLIKLHEEEWDGKPNTTGEDGFFGKLNEMRKKITATVVQGMVDTTPPNEKK